MKQWRAAEAYIYTPGLGILWAQGRRTSLTFSVLVRVGDEPQKYLTLTSIYTPDSPDSSGPEEDIIHINPNPVRVGDEQQKYLTLTCSYTQGSSDSSGSGGGHH